MKKTLLLFIFSLSINLAFAQGLKFSIIAGLNSSTASQIPDYYMKRIAFAGETFPNSHLVGFHFGAFAELPYKSVSFQTGVLYTTKGGIPYSSSETSDNPYSRKDMLRLDYLELPVNVLYHLPIGIGKFFIGGGPYIGVGISGKQSYTIVDNTEYQNKAIKGNTNVTYGSDYNDIKTTDFGLGAQIGFVLKNGLLIRASYGYGLTNISNDPRYKGENKTLGLSLGYSFR